MYFKSIKTENFRNYENLFLEFDPKLNIITGANAQGKTNLLESLFINSLGKSFRTNKDSDMILFGKNFARVSSVVYDDGKETEIELVYSKEGKTAKIDGVKINRSMELLENVYIVVFSPDDLRIVKDGPESRRRFLDRELCQIKPFYYSNLGNYKRVLKQRNTLLKNKERDKHLIEVFNESLAEYGVRIIEERYNFSDKLAEISNKIHSDISGKKENLDICYETCFKRNISVTEYKEILDSSTEEDYYRGFTTKGPHKDDICIRINDTDIRSFGSQGQQRTAALSLKLAELSLIKEETGKNAVLLLDDVLSELDINRQKYLISSMSDYQVFITAAYIDDVLYGLLPSGRAFYVDNGKVDLYNRLAMPKDVLGKGGN